MCKIIERHIVKLSRVWRIIMEDKCFLVVPQMIDMWMKKEYISREMLGIEYLGAALKKENIDCVILNAYAQRLTNHEVCQEIIQGQYKIVGISCPSQRSYPFAKDLAKKLSNFSIKKYLIKIFLNLRNLL